MLYFLIFRCYYIVNTKRRRFIPSYMEQTRQRRKRDATHKAIMHSAKMLFEEYGIGNVTIDKIAHNADVSRSTFFTHFDSLDDLLTQIADEEIDDIIKAADKQGADIDSVLTQFTEDTYNYPYLMCELLVKSLMNEGVSSVSRIFTLLENEIESDGFGGMLKDFSPKDVSAIIIGAYFGMIFQKFALNEDFDDKSEMNKKIKKFIKILRSTEEIQL